MRKIEREKARKSNVEVEPENNIIEVFDGVSFSNFE